MGVGGKIFGALFFFPFLVPNIKHLPKFLEYALPVGFPHAFFPLFDAWFLSGIAHYSMAALESNF